MEYPTHIWISLHPDKDVQRKIMDNINARKDAQAKLNRLHSSWDMMTQDAFMWSVTPEGYEYWEGISNAGITAPGTVKPVPKRKTISKKVIGEMIWRAYNRGWDNSLTQDLQDKNDIISDIWKEVLDEV